VIEHYERYPSTPEALATWRAQRDDLMETVYEVTGAEPKY
jgi:hypothetical protein